MDLDTIIDKWFSTRDQKITWSITLAFFIIFPVYFANIAAFLPDGAMVSGGASVTGEWEVTFSEGAVATSESTEPLMDGEEFEFEITLLRHCPPSRKSKVPLVSRTLALPACHSKWCDTQHL